MLSYDTTVRLLEERRKQIAQDLAMCERRAQELQEKMRGPEADDETFFPFLTLAAQYYAVSGGPGVA